MELPVNSVDSYNLIEGKKSIGKFGMGFFSILYWISESIRGEFLRSLLICSTYRDKISSELKSYSIELKWTIDGLSVEKLNQNNFICDLSDPLFLTNPRISNTVTGTTIYLNCNNHHLTDKNINKMNQQLYKLFPIEGSTIYINGIPINQKYQNIVNIKMNKFGLIIEDNATGISEDILIRSLLVPSSSSKERINEIEPFRNPVIIENLRDELNIIVNGVCINNIFILEPQNTQNTRTQNTKKYRYNIYMPYNSKVPVSRDNIIYDHESLEIETFGKSLMLLMNSIVGITGNLVPIFKLLEMYLRINSSDVLSRKILNIRTAIENSPYILLPDNSFWIDIRKKCPIEKRNNLIIYPYPKLYETEKKLEIFFGESIRHDVFKLRKVIFGDFRENISSNGLTTYLFISNRMNDERNLTSLALSNDTTLLIPNSDSFELGFYEDFYSPDEIWLNKYTINLIKNNQRILDMAKILKMTFMRKFSNLKITCKEYVVKTVNKVFIASHNDEKFTLRFLTTLNSKICNKELNFAYGSKPYLFDKYLSNKYLYKLEIKNNETSNVKFNNLIKQTTKDLLLFSMELISIKTDNLYVCINRFDEFLYTLHPFCKYPQNVINECIIGIENCVTNAEKFVYLTIFIKFISEIKQFKKMDGLSLFLVNEIRRKASSNELMEILQYFYFSVGSGHYIDGKLFSPLKMAVDQFYTYSNSPMIPREIEIGNMYKFSCKSLIQYVYNQDLNDNTFQELTDSYPTFNPKNTKLQVVEIAVNEGTNKSFINSVLTEIIQNSVDAIRSTPESSKYIDINITNNIISVTDYVGFDDIINILIPFLSSKNPNDPNVTGEMGTGFFNVYRQPWTRFIVIESIYNGVKKTVKATPLSNENVVYDIEYKIIIERTELPNSTTISIFLEKSNTLLSQMITDAFIFTNSYLSFIKSAIIRLNGSIVKKNYTVCYPENDPRIPTQQFNQIGDIMTIEDPTTLSYVLTNDIPFMPLMEFISSFNNPLITNMVNKFGRNSIVINLNKNIYKPTQARSKIQFVPEYLSLVNSFVGFGIYNAILFLYERDHYFNPDEIIMHTKSMVKPTQLKLSLNNDSIIQSLDYPYLIYLETGNPTLYRNNNVMSLINNAIDRKVDYKNIDQSTIAGRILYKWFSNKNEIDKKDDLVLIKVQDKEFSSMQIFINIYWRLFHQLIDEKIIISLKPNIKPPKIYLGKLDPGVLGQYNTKLHKIVLSSSHYDEESFVSELSKIKGIKLSSITTMFNINHIFSKYFSPCKPANCLLHEIGHAFTNSCHSDSYHDTTNIKIRNSNHLSFEDMCVQIYQLCVERDLINEFLESI